MPARLGPDGAPYCAYCGDPVSLAVGYQRATGWVRARRSMGGTNALRVRELRDEFACSVCIERLAAGLPAAQSSIPGAA